MGEQQSNFASEHDAQSWAAQEDAHFPADSIEAVPIPAEERCLTEVVHLNDYREADGSHSEWAKQQVLVNLLTAVKEAAMPYAISTTFQEFVPHSPPEHDDAGRRLGTYRWLGKTALQVAESGLRYHRHEAARARVREEIAEAVHIERRLEPGMMQVFISPKMSETDAPRDVAEAEHLATDDSLRVTWLDVDEAQQPRGKYVQSLLVRHVPLEAWVAMLRDPENIFGQTVEVEDERSALAVIKTHEQLCVPAELLPEGPVTLVEAVLPYVADQAAYEEISTQLELFRTDQADMHQKAERIAARWLQFEMSMADSLDAGYATADIVDFAEQCYAELPSHARALIDARRFGAELLMMDTKLAAVLETARQNTLWTAAAVVTRNEQVLKQLDPVVAARIYDEEMFIQQLQYEHYAYEEIQAVEAENNRLIARQNVEVGAGCAGLHANVFGNDSSGDGGEKKEEKSKLKSMHCPHCNARVIADPCARVLHCWSCKTMVVYGSTYKRESASQAKNKTVEAGRHDGALAASDQPKSQRQAAETQLRPSVAEAPYSSTAERQPLPPRPQSRASVALTA